MRIYVLFFIGLTFPIFFGCPKSTPPTNFKAVEGGKFLIPDSAMLLFQPSNEILNSTYLTEFSSFDSMLVLTPKADSSAIELKPTYLDKYKYLVAEIEHSNNFSLLVHFDFYTEGDSKPRIGTKIGALPGLKTPIIFPLEDLNGQKVYLDRYPVQLKGTTLGSNTLPNEVFKIKVSFKPYQDSGYVPTFKLGRIYLTNQLPNSEHLNTEPIADSLGQWTFRNWPNKTKSRADLKVLADSLLSISESAKFPDGFNRFGGNSKLKLKPATGFFSVHHDGKRFYFADPDGYAFLSTGIDGIRMQSPGPFYHLNHKFLFLPDTNTNPEFKFAYKKRSDGIGEYSAHITNIITMFGTDYFNKWATSAKGMLMGGGFNTIANWSDEKLCATARLPYVYPMKKFPRTDLKIYRDFSDVYDPTFREQAKIYAQQLEPMKNDSFLIGYFLDNEPLWAFGENNVAFEMFATNTQSHSKKAFVTWIGNRYKNIEILNAAWGTQFKSFDELQNSVIRKRSEISKQAYDDFWQFSYKLVDTLVATVCEEVKKVDPNHLNLGLRYAWISSELCYRAGAFFDVFSINGYSYPGPPPTAEITRRSGKPVLIGEFHFGACDRGLPANGIFGADNQVDRGKGFSYYVEQGFARPELIGIHYFCWNDQPIQGRYDGENYQVGMVDVCFRPYKEMWEYSLLTNSKIYDIASGKVKPTSEIIKKVPQIYY